MKRKYKLLLVVVILLFFLYLLVAINGINNKSWNQNVRYLGRTYCDGEAIVLDYTCSGIEFLADFSRGG